MRKDGVTAADGASVGALMVAQEGIRWCPAIRVDKWDPGQVSWARDRLDLPARAGDPSGDELSALLAPCAVLEDAGNLLTTAGLNRLTSLLIGAGGQAVTNTSARLGVGNSTTAAAVGQTDLQAASGAGNRQFKVMDATYPTQSNGVVTLKSTFASGEANFAWEEWGVDVGTPTVSDGTTVNALLLNRKVQSLGTKVSGAVWALTATITFS